MNVVVISECHGRSRKRSQAILDTFLPRIGSRAWAGAITSEGLERLRRTLKEGATRSTAVICRLGAPDRLPVRWRVGRRSAFDAAGHFPIGIRSRVRIPEENARRPTQEYVALLVHLAGLVHDLGKASTDFVAKLDEGTRIQDRLRHEFLSVALLLGALDRGLPGLHESRDKDAAVLGFLAGGFLDTVDGLLRDPGRPLREEVAGVLSGKPFLDRLPEQYGRVAAHLCWLVITHHRLCTSRIDSRNVVTPTALGFVATPDREALRGLGLNGERKAIEAAARKVAEGAAFKAGLDRFGTAGEVAELRKAFAGGPGKERGKQVDGVPARIAGLLQANGGMVPASDATVQHHGRIALMLGDHHASAVGNRAAAAPKSRNLLYANRPRGAAGLWGQRLARHLVAVGRAAGVAARALARRTRDFPALVGDAVPPHLSEPSSADPRFAWQARAADMVEAGRRGAGSAGFLCVLAASTGTGKTRAVPSILLAADRDSGLRYSVGLGLRSLTLQTAHEYVGRLGFAPEAVGVAVGSALARRLAQVRQEDMDADEAVAPGADAGAEDVGPVVADAPVLDLPGVALRMNRHARQDDEGTLHESVDRAARRFLASPVLVSTLDQLMPVATSTRGGFLVSALRTATSDLVVDELDDFAPEDVVAICRLVEHAAAFGRSVVVSSATLPPPVARAVFDAYATGRRLHADWTGEAAATDVAWVHEDVLRFERVPHAEGLGSAAFEAAHASFARDLCASLAARHPGRRLAILDGPMTEAPWEAAAAAMRGLHEAHHVRDPSTGMRVSAGVLRLANVAPAVRAAHHLATAGHAGGLPVVVVPYTGSLLPAVRHHVEAALDRCLTRHGDPDPLLSEGSPLRALVDRHAAAGATDLALVVVTTSLEEVGRDHDFDWALTEPVSERALIQLAGRVRRHRAPFGPEAPANVAMLPASVRAARGEERPYSKPGVQDRWRNLHGSGDPNWKLPSDLATDLFAGDGLDGRIDATPVVRPDMPASPMAAYGRRRWGRFLAEGAGDGVTPASRAHPRFPRHCDAHHVGRRFRRTTMPEQEYRLGGAGWRMLDGNGGDMPAGRRFSMLADVERASLLVPFDVESARAAAYELSARMSPDGPEDYVDDLLSLTLRTREGAPEILWHPSFGAFGT